MTNPDTHFARIAAVGLLVTALIQISVVALHTPGAEHANPNALMKWRIEIVAYMAIMLFGGALIRSHPLTGSGLAACGVFNVIQLGIGLYAFRPLLDGGAALEPVFDAMWSFAFSLYFAGKVGLGLAALAYGGELWRSRAGPWRMIGGLVALAGVIGLVAGLAAMVAGPGLIFLAGATGVIAALVLAGALAFAPPRGT